MLTEQHSLQAARRIRFPPAPRIFEDVFPAQSMCAPRAMVLDDGKKTGEIRPTSKNGVRSPVHGAEKLPGVPLQSLGGVDHPRRCRRCRRSVTTQRFGVMVASRSYQAPRRTGVCGARFPRPPLRGESTTCRVSTELSRRQHGSISTTTTPRVTVVADKRGVSDDQSESAVRRCPCRAVRR